MHTRSTQISVHIRGGRRLGLAAPDERTSTCFFECVYMCMHACICVHPRGAGPLCSQQASAAVRRPCRAAGACAQPSNRPWTRPLLPRRSCPAQALRRAARRRPHAKRGCQGHVGLHCARDCHACPARVRPPRRRSGPCLKIAGQAPQRAPDRRAPRGRTCARPR